MYIFKFHILNMSFASLFCIMQANTILLYNLIPEPKIMYNFRPQMKCYSNHHIFPFKRSFNGYCSRKRGYVSVKCNVNESESGDEEPTALETVHMLYEALRNRDVRQISDIIAEECLCFSNLFSRNQPFHGKKQVLDFFTKLMKKLGNNIEFAVRNTVDDGMVVTVSWKLEWKNIPLPLGKGFTLYICHVYSGKVMIKNVEIFLEPVLYAESIRLKVIALATNALTKLINLSSLYKNRRRLRPIEILFILLFMTAILLFLSHL